MKCSNAGQVFPQAKGIVKHLLWSLAANTPRQATNELVSEKRCKLLNWSYCHNPSATGPPISPNKKELHMLPQFRHRQDLLFWDVWGVLGLDWTPESRSLRGPQTRPVLLLLGCKKQVKGAFATQDKVVWAKSVKEPMVPVRTIEQSRRDWSNEEEGPRRDPGGIRRDSGGTPEGPQGPCLKGDH